MIDVMIYGNGITSIVDDIHGWEPKFTYDNILSTDQTKSIIDLATTGIDLINDIDKRYYNNRYELIVQDTKTEMYYIAPGDLLTDTLVMIWQSITGKDIPPQNPNKLVKYLIKYSFLLDSINRMIDICPDNTCNRINTHIMTRNTDTNISFSDEEKAEQYRIFTLAFFINVDNFSDKLNDLPKIKLREMSLFLNIYYMIINLM
jgi:hypothetical protein